MSDLREGYKYIYCPHHPKKKLGQIKKGTSIDGAVLVFCNLCKHVVEVESKGKDENKDEENIF